MLCYGKLLEGGVAWHWESEQQKSFERQTLVSNTPVLKNFDFSKEIMLSVDTSAEGLGAVLLQEGHLVAFGSRSLTECQKRCAQIDKELLAIVYSREKFHHYVFGKTVQVVTDHKRQCLKSLSSNSSKTAENADKSAAV